MAAQTGSKRKFLARLSLMVITLPLLYVLIFELPFADFLVLNLWIIAFGLFGGREVERFFEARGEATHRWLAPALGATIPLVTYLEVSGRVGEGFLLFWLCILLLVVLTASMLARNEKRLHLVLERLSSSVLVILYPGLLLSFVVRLTAVPDASRVLLFFLCLIFTNDILAYLVGKFIARGLLRLAISPRKTVAGFSAGFLGSIGMSAIFYHAFPQLFSGSIVPVLALGALIGAGTITGDLVESALKRSAGVKDSGTIMIGRGGLMDSIDSIIFCAPLFYYVFNLIS